MVTVGQGAVRPGETVHGKIDAGMSVDLVLLRLEISPAGTVATRLAVGQANAAGEYALELPAGAVPTAAGRKCAIEYVVRTEAERGRPPVDVRLVKVAGRLETARVQEAFPYADRIIARFEARRFHIELSEVDIQGRGRLAGRVHLHPGKTAHGLVVTCRCVESWRVNGRSIIHNRRQPPLWKTESIWGESAPVEWRDGETWSAFGVALPEGLPPAVEARSIAWRYEVEARLRTRLGLSDTAVATPMGFEIASS